MPENPSTSRDGIKVRAIQTSRLCSPDVDSSTNLDHSRDGQASYQQSCLSTDVYRIGVSSLPMEPSDSIILVPRSPQGLVVVEEIQCSCGHRSLEHARVTFESIKRSGVGWKAGGHAICPVCAAAARAIKRDIPVLASTFKCPKCNSTRALK